MKKKCLMAAIHELEEVKQEQLAELNETEKIIFSLRKLAGDVAIPASPTTPDIPMQDHPKKTKKTYARIVLDLLKETDLPLHINEITEGIHKAKNLPAGSIARPSVQTTIMRMMKNRPGLIKKAGPAKFQYIKEALQ